MYSSQFVGFNIIAPPHTHNMRDLIRNKMKDCNFGRGVGCLEAVFPDQEHYPVLEDCRVAFTSKNTEGRAYSVGTTFFITADEEPRCLLEKMALEVFAYHADRLGIEFDAENSGAEWWTQVIDARDDIGFHWDRDYGEEENGKLIYPTVATVTYLTNCGGATWVLPCTGSTTEETSSGFNKGASRLNSLVFSLPRKGKHLHFDGRLLHAAPADFNGTEQDDDEDSGNSSDSDEEDDDTAPIRVTFLVNVWLNHIPLQSCPYPAEDLNQMSDWICCYKCGDAARESDKVREDESILTLQKMTKEKKNVTINPVKVDCRAECASLAKKPAVLAKQMKEWHFCDLQRKYVVKLPVLNVILKTLDKSISGGKNHLFIAQLPDSAEAFVMDNGEANDSEEECEELEKDEEEEEVEEEEAPSLPPQKAAAGTKRKR